MSFTVSDNRTQLSYAGNRTAKIAFKKSHSHIMPK
jgi:hypothetical protein